MCARLSRWVALPSGPIAITNGLAEVSRIENEQKQLSQKIEQMMAEWEKVESEIAEV